ncbi:hypothetical protein M413DRAFT_64051 [Hebeloma cylindrosporum]|uniref:Cytochrome P450 n=1 Tax=Hebeloma cylindrosporum TaxID=76867 RepID=A0A0C3CE79_HEBCY|nr:hypothetical protein M413DRAFT_64051 [Hebeloma cylindrosporum h7]
MFDLDRSPTSIFGFVALACLLAVSAKSAFGLLRTKNRYPPGPKGLPFFGTRLSSTPWKDFEEWGKEYGDIMYIESLGKGILVLNSHAAAVDLLDRRGGNYSNRQIFVVNEYLTRGLSFGLANYGDMWRRMRRAGHECLSKTGVTRYYQIQQREALILTDNLLRHSKEWDQEVYRTAASGLLSAVYDMPPTQSASDPLIAKFNHFHEILINAVSPGLIEYFPWVQYLPAQIMPWKKNAQSGFVELSTFFMNLFRGVQTQMDGSINENPGFAEYLVREGGQLGLDEIECAWLAANMYVSTEAILWFFLAMIAYPAKQRKCQEELDSIVGRSRMPTFEDRENLPYLKATVRELLRWRAISPLGTKLGQCVRLSLTTSYY